MIVFILVIGCLLCHLIGSNTVSVNINDLCNKSAKKLPNLVCSGCHCLTNLKEADFLTYSNVHNSYDNYEEDMLFQLSYSLKLVDESQVNVQNPNYALSWILSRPLVFFNFTTVNASTLVKQEVVFNLRGISFNTTPALVIKLHDMDNVTDGIQIDWRLDDLSITYVKQPSKFIFPPKPVIRDLVLIPRPVNWSSSDITDMITYQSSDGRQTTYNDVFFYTMALECRLLGFSDAVILNEVEVHVPTPTEVVNSVTVLCAVFTMEKNHNKNIRSMINTWGRKCTQFIAFSTIDDISVSAIHIPHIGVETYQNMWQKSRAIWKYIYKHFRHEFDYFLMGGDDMYYIMENLYAYLNSDEIREERGKGNGMYLGKTLRHPFVGIDFNSGGCGYLLDSIALETLIFNFNEPHCKPEESISSEDANIGLCLNGSVNAIRPYNTIDTFDRQRFHPFTPGFMFTYQPSTNVPLLPNDFWYDRYDNHIRTGYDCCSVDSIAFHFVWGELMDALDDYIYKCPLVAKEYYYSLYGKSYYEINSLNGNPDN